MAQFLPVLLRLSLLGSVLAGALLLVRLALWEHVSRRVYYYLWVFVLLRLCVPLGVTFPVPVLDVENPFAVLRSSGAGAPAPLLRRTAKGFSTSRTGTGKVTPRGTHSRSKTNTHR